MQRKISIELITVGHELLTGSTENTNSTWIARRISRIGEVLSRIVVVDDVYDEICEALKSALRRNSKFIIFVGGLGPTYDDITLESAARCLEIPLELNEKAMQMIKEHYEKRKIDVEITEERKKMATLPLGSEPLKNEKGTAPGVRLQYGESVIFFLPGVPREMKYIYRNTIEKEIIQSLGKVFRLKKKLRVIDIMESQIAPLLKNLHKTYPSVYIKSHPKGFQEGISTLEIEIDVRNSEEAKVQNLSQEITSAISSFVSMNKGKVEEK